MLFLHKSIYSLFFAHLSVFPSSMRNVLQTVYSQCHEMQKIFSELALNSVEWRTNSTKQFHFICVFMSDFFFRICGACRTQFWLSAHTKVVCNILLDRLWTAYSLLKCLSDDFPIKSFYLSSKRSTLLSFLKIQFI